MEASPAANNERRRVIRGARNRALKMDIPAFGDWDFLHHDHVPITQYFDFCHSPAPRADSFYPYPACFPPPDALFLHYENFQQQHYRPCKFPTPIVDPTINWQRGGGPQVNGECGTRRRRRQRQHRRSCLENKNRVFDFDTTAATLTEAFTTPTTESSNAAVPSPADVVKSKSKSKNNFKAKDEDLYKIPPELLRNCKSKKRMSKFFECFMTVCASY